MNGVGSRQRLRRLDQIRRRVSLLVKYYTPRSEARMQPLQKKAEEHLLRLGAVLLHGQPKIDEPLAHAWQRTVTHYGLGANSEIQGVDLRVVVVTHRVNSELPGETKHDKLQYIFDHLPSWLLVFTCAFQDQTLLALGRRDVSDSPRGGHIGLHEGYQAWPDLPAGTFLKGNSVANEKHDLLVRQFSHARLESDTASACQFYAELDTAQE